MLRSKAAASQPEDFTSGQWRPVIGDDSADAGLVERVLRCSGKVAWDLLAARDQREDKRTAIVRVEQLYPRPLDDLNAILAGFPNATEVRWVQDEPANQGPWPHLALHLPGNLERNLPLSLVGRPESSTTAVGSHSRHVDEQEALMDRAFA
jgi:2-oxoglutarate decarboxylase